MEATTWERQSGSDNLEATTCDPYRLPIACELDLINAISAADIAFIILLGQPWRHETYVSTNENACFGWSVGFHNKPRDSRWRTKRVANALQCHKCTGRPSSLVTVNMTLRNSVIIRVCMGNTSILRNSSKIRGKYNKIDLPFLVVCITSVSMAFGGVLERF